MTPDERNRFLSKFLRESGYGPSDLLAVNIVTRIVMTRNGGIYQVPEVGRVRRLEGPPVEPEERD